MAATRPEAGQSLRVVEGGNAVDPLIVHTVTTGIVKQVRLMSRRFVTLLITLGLTLGVTTQVMAQDTPRLEPADCEFLIPSPVPVTCSTLVVPESRTGLSDAEIRLAVAVFPAENPSGEPPLVFLQGGPGGEIVSTSPIYYTTFTDVLNDTRDVIFIDQRGTGLSEPRLDCPEFVDLITRDLEQNLDLESVAAASVEALQVCRNTLEAQGITLAAYTSAENAADIADLASALGVGQIDLYGASYGSRLALTIMRDFPDLVRASVLDAVLGPEGEQVADTAFIISNGTRGIFEDCAADPDCSAAYPDLEAHYFAVVERLNAEPVTVTLTVDPLAGETIEAVMDGTDFQTAVFYALYQTSLIPSIPAAIESAFEEDYAPVASFWQLMPQTFSMVALGMNQSILCAEEILGRDVGALQAALDQFPEFALAANQNVYGGAQAALDGCAVWGVEQADPIENEPVTSSVPTLLLAGGNDPVTPFVFAERVAEGLETSVAFEFPGVGHVVALADACALELVASFLNDPSADLDSSCLDSVTLEFQAGPVEFTLIPLENEMFGFSTVMPEGWSELSPGTFGESMMSDTALLALALPGSQATAIELLSSQFPSPLGESVGTYESESGVWTLYAGDLLGQSLDLAAQEVDGVTYVIGLITGAAVRNVNYDAILLPALDAFTIN